MENSSPVMIVFAFAMSYLSVTLGAPVECLVPSNHTLQQLHSQLVANGGALLPEMHSETVSREFVIEHHLYGDIACPAEAATGVDDVLEDRSICPWYGVVNHDPTRYPSMLVEAKCKCQKCIKNNALQCQPVMYTIPVLQQNGECNNGFFVYEHRQISIAVGCTCAEPRSALAHPPVEEIPELPF